MPSSIEFNKMKSALTEHRKHFLPKAFSPTGTYNKRQIALARAYRIAAHAEIEWYLERLALRLSKSAFDNYTNSGSLKKPLMGAICFSGRTHEKPAKSLNAQKVLSLDISAVYKKSYECHREAIENNHGIKEENLLLLLLPLGIDPKTIDVTLIADLESLGRQRGEAAHTSVKGKLLHPPDPKSEYDLVTKILCGLIALDTQTSVLI